MRMLSRVLLLVALGAAAPALAAMSPAPTKAQLQQANEPSPEQKAAIERKQKLTDQLQELLGSDNSQQALTQGMAVASMLGCTSNRAGKQQTDTLYKKMQDVGKQVGALCKAEQPAQARELVLRTLRENQYHQVVMAANNCYAQQKNQFNAMAGERLAGEVGNYARWVRDPRAAQRELTEKHVCP